MAMEINFYNVEHGNCTHIITPLGQHILIDCGARGNESIAGFIYNSYAINKKNALILTHPHKDHFSDIKNVHSRLSPFQLHRPQDGFNVIKNTENDPVINYAINLNETYIYPIPPNQDVIDSSNNGEIEIKIFESPENLKTTKDLNSYSMVIVVKYANKKMVLTGDNHPTILKSMLNENEGFKTYINNADILLAPHHGRTSDFCKEFFDWVEPKLTIISDKEIVHESQEYSSSYYSNTRRLLVDGKKRNVVSTRESGGVNIKVMIDSDGNLIASTNKDY